MNDSPPPHEASPGERDPGMGWALMQFDWGNRAPGPRVLPRWRTVVRAVRSGVLLPVRYARVVLGRALAVVCPRCLRSASTER
jgi:hypothetical protein